MRFPGDKPQWIVMQEEDIENERNRRISSQLVGKMTPPVEYIIEKMKRRYSKYGKWENKEYSSSKDTNAQNAGRK